MLTFVLGFYSVAILTSMAAMELGAWALVLTMASQWITGRKPIRLGPDLWIWGLFAAAVSSLLLSPVPQASLQLADKFRWIIVLYAVAWAWFQQSPKSIENIIKLLIGATVIASLYSVVEFLWGIEFFRSRQILYPMGPFFRASGFFNLSLTFAYVVGMVGFLCAGRFWVMPISKWLLPENRVWLVGAIAALVGCIVSLTRGSWVAIFVASTIVLLLVQPRRVLTVLSVFSLVFLVGMGASRSFRERVLSIGDFSDRTNQHRFVIWQGNLEVFKAHPILGVGFGANGYVAPDYFDRSRGFTREQAEEFYDKLTVERPYFYTHAHNNFLHILAGTGIVGIICYLMIVGTFLILSWRTYKRAILRSDSFRANIALGILGAQIFFHVGGLTEANFIDSEVNHALIYLWGLLVATSKQIEA